MEHGTRQAMVVFTLPGDAREFATAVGFLQGNEETYYCDLLFFYDDPHTIYTNWPKDVWAAVDAHQVKQGMNELQTRLGDRAEDASRQQERGQPYCDLRPGREEVDGDVCEGSGYGGEGRVTRDFCFRGWWFSMSEKRAMGHPDSCGLVHREMQVPRLPALRSGRSG